METKEIFISHSSKDDELVKSFVDRILVLGLKIKSEKIFCTSIENLGIKSGLDFKNEIEQQLKSAKYTIQIITSNYKASEICLNEMGAAWMLSKNVIPFILEPVRYDNIGFIYKTTQLLKLNNKTDLLKFRDDYKELYEAADFNSANYDRQIEDFLKSLIQKPTTPAKVSTPFKLEASIFKNYFDKFLVPDIDRANLILKAQPTLFDCREIFKPQYFREVYSAYSKVFTAMLDRPDDLRPIANKTHIGYKQITYDTIQTANVKKPDPSMFPLLINSGTVFYTVSFREYGKDAGYDLYLWCYINNRWVFFMKPQRALAGIMAKHTKAK